MKIFSAHKSRQHFLLHSRTHTRTHQVGAGREGEGLETSIARVSHKNKAQESTGQREREQESVPQRESSKESKLSRCVERKTKNENENESESEN